MTKLRIEARKSQSGLIFKVIDCFKNGISIVGDAGHSRAYSYSNGHRVALIIGQ